MRTTLNEISGETLQGLLAFDAHREYIELIKTYTKECIEPLSTDSLKRKFKLATMDQLSLLFVLNPEMSFSDIVEAFINEMKDSVCECMTWGIDAVEFFTIWIKCRNSSIAHNLQRLL